MSDYLLSNLRNYGFTYEQNGREFALDVMAASAEEAIKRVQAMAQAKYVGKLILDKDCKTEQ